jgi:hypothetical protein
MATPTTQPPDWKSLYETAIYARDLAPWNWMFEDEIFGIEVPGEHATWYCSIMGTGGEHYAYCFYEGERGLNFHLAMRDLGTIDEADQEMVFNAIMMQQCMQVTFEDRELIDPAQMKMIKKLGLTFRGKSQWVSLLDYTPGFLPWLIADNRVNLLHTLLDTATAIAYQKRDKPEWFGSWEDFGDPMPIFTMDGEKLRKKTKKVKINVDLKLPEPQALSFPDEWDALQQLPKKNELMICGTYQTRAQVQEHPDMRPFFAVIRIFIHPGNGRILGIVTCNPYQPESEEWELLGFFRQIQYRPAQILTADPEASLALQLGCQRAGIEQAFNLKAKEIMEEVSASLREMGGMG